MLFYPLVCSVVFFLPVAVGILGRLSFPDLAGKAADRILPLLMTEIAGDTMASLVIAAGLAALMSTMDSQLLTLGSIVTRDILPAFGVKSDRRGIHGRTAVVVLGIVGLALAYEPPATILAIATETFTGLAVLFPAVLFGLYRKAPKASAAVASILAGETVMLLCRFHIIPTFGFLPVIPVMITAFSAYLLVEAAVSGSFAGISLSFLISPYFWAFSAIFVFAMDFYAWNLETSVFFGIPAWIFRFLLLSIIQTAVMVLWIRSSTKTSTIDRTVGETNT